jgi:outer membrane protein assembly factor BamB
MSGWGYSESPLVDGEKLLCTPGGGNGSIIALNKMTGETIWRCTDLNDAATYSSIIAADVFGVHQYIQMLKDGVAGVKADDGKRLWYYERGVRTAGIPTPIYSNGYVYSTAGYGVGCDLIKLTASDGNFSAQKVYHGSLSNHHGGVVLLDGYIYGYFDGHGWVCQEFTTGKVMWEAKGTGKPGKGSLTYADGHLFCYDERSGTCHVIEASPKAYKETGQIKLPKKSEIRSGRGGIWTHPVIANGKLYLRDQDLLFCFDIKK